MPKAFASTRITPVSAKDRTILSGHCNGALSRMSDAPGKVKEKEKAAENQMLQWEHGKQPILGKEKANAKTILETDMEHCH